MREFNLGPFLAWLLLRTGEAEESILTCDKFGMILLDLDYDNRTNDFVNVFGWPGLEFSTLSDSDLKRVLLVCNFSSFLVKDSYYCCLFLSTYYLAYSMTLRTGLYLFGLRLDYFLLSSVFKIGVFLPRFLTVFIEIGFFF